MIDNYNRNIDTLRISVTDRCNLRCFYCYEEYEYLEKDKILSFEQIVKFIENGINLGIKRIKLTGGEPLLREDIEVLVKMISQVSAIEDISITTNGILLGEKAYKLKKAGLHRINVSLDTLNKEKYKKITGGGDIDSVLKSLMIAKKLNFNNIKINTVILRGLNEDEIYYIKKFAIKNNFDMQLINHMNLKKDKSYSESNITDKPKKCNNCNRIRLTANGMLLPCLFSEKSVYIMEYSDYKDAIKDCINLKPEKGEYNKKLIMPQIGG